MSLWVKAILPTSFASPAKQDAVTDPCGVVLPGSTEIDKIS